MLSSCPKLCGNIRQHLFPCSTKKIFRNAHTFPARSMILKDSQIRQVQPNELHLVQYARTRAVRYAHTAQREHAKPRYLWRGEWTNKALLSKTRPRTASFLFSATGPGLRFAADTPYFSASVSPQVSRLPHSFSTRSPDQIVLCLLHYIGSRVLLNFVPHATQ